MGHILEGRGGLWKCRIKFIVVKEGGILFWEGGSRFWEGRRCLKWGYILGRMVDSVSVAFRCLRGDIFQEGGVDYVSAT